MIALAIAAGVVVVIGGVVVVVIDRARQRDQDLGVVPLTAERRALLNDVQHRQHQTHWD